MRRVLKLSRGRGVQVRVCGGEEVWRVVKEGLEKLENVEVRRSPTVGTTSRVDVSVGDAVGESVLCESRVGLVWLVDAHWTMAQYRVGRKGSISGRCRGFGRAVPVVRDA